MPNSVRAIEDERNFSDKTVLIRIDSDVDMGDGIAKSEKRLEAACESIDYVLGYGGNVILIGHYKRPDGKADPELSLKPVAEWFARQYHGHVEEETIGPLRLAGEVRSGASDFPAFKITPRISLLENIRFYPEEEKNDAEFSKKLAKLGDLFVNEAFAVSHRKHASVYGITHYLPSFAGKHFVKEIEILSKVMEDPDRPLVIIIGGAKIETKLPLVEKMHHIADYVLVGGEIAAHVKELIKVQHAKMQGMKAVVLVADIKENGKDITQMSAENFAQILPTAKTIVWNGPVGETGKDPENEEGTFILAHAIAASPAYSIIGGGDTAAFLGHHKMLGKYDFVSTGGGAMLEFLSGKKLPGIEALEE